MGKYIRILILIGIILLGCHSTKEKIEFSNRVICSDSISRELVVLNDTFLFSYPLQIECINNKFFHLFTLKGVPIKSLEKKGKGLLTL